MSIFLYNFTYIFFIWNVTHQFLNFIFIGNIWTIQWRTFTQMYSTGVARVPTVVRDRPFNLKGGLWFFVSFRNFFIGQHKSWNIFFLPREAGIFFPNLTLGYMTKTLNQIIFFFLHQNQNIFFSNIGNQNIFLEKNHNPPPSS